MCVCAWVWVCVWVYVCMCVGVGVYVCVRACASIVCGCDMFLSPACGCKCVLTSCARVAKDGRTWLHINAGYGRSAVVAYCVAERGMDMEARDRWVRSSYRAATAVCTQK